MAFWLDTASLFHLQGRLGDELAPTLKRRAERVKLS